jgi:hypothetical protein
MTHKHGKAIALSWSGGTNGAGRGKMLLRGNTTHRAAGRGGRRLSSGVYVGGTLLAFAIVSTFAVLGKWVLWTWRPDMGHLVSA